MSTCLICFLVDYLSNPETFACVEDLSAGMYERAQLRFAHAETIVPFTCLLGLFLEGHGEILIFIGLNKLPNPIHQGPESNLN